MTVTRRKQIALSLLPPVAALIVQLLFWSDFRPLVWFLFYPAVFLSSWLGGRVGGWLATLLSTIFVVYYFIPPTYSFQVGDPRAFLSVIVFVIMGGLFSEAQARLREERQRADKALAAARQDFDDLQEAEARLREAQALLETRVAERTHELQVANQRLQSVIQEEQDLRTALDAHAIVAITDPQGKIIFVNNKFCEIAQYSREELIGQDHRLVNGGHHPKEFFRELWATIGAGKVWHGEIKNRAKDGSDYWVATTIVPFLGGDGRPRQYVAIRADVTERKRAEESQVRLAAIVQSSDDAIITKTLDGIMTSWNRGAEKIFGYTAEETVGRPLMMLVPPERAAEEREILELIARGESVNHFETVRVRKDGRRIHISVTLSPLRDRGGAVVGVSKIARDITEHLAAQEALRLSEVQMKVVIESLEDGLVIADEEHQLVHWNPAALRIHGFTSAADGRRALVELDQVFELQTLAGEVVPLARWPMSRVLRGEVLRGVELRVLRPGTQWRRIFGYTGSQVAYVGGKKLAFLTVSDITERKEAEALFLAMAGAEVGTWRWDIPQGELQWSDLCRQIFGAPREKVMTQEDFWAAFPAAERIRVGAAVQGALAGRVDFDTELAMRWADGSTHWLALKGRGSYSPEGKPERMEGVAMDITARKKSEAEIRALYADQKHRASLLDGANRELEAFSYSVSHDLRAPLRHITGFAQLLKKEALPLLPTSSQHHLEVIAGATKRMGDLIDDLLNFSRVGRVGMQKTAVALTDLVRDVVAGLETEMEGRRVTWQVAALPVVQADGALLRQVMANLLGNAVKFTSTRDEARIEVGAREDQEILVYVRDNGVGFDPKYGHKLFGVFQRLHNQSEFEGTGIGLANVQRIIHRHGGRVWAEGAVDGGATFYFTLPKETQMKGTMT